MLTIVQTLNFLLWLYLLVLIARAIIGLVQNFSRDWRPTGALLVVANVVYALTDPPLNAIRRYVPPLRIGAVSLDTAFIILFLAVQLLRGFVLPLLLL